MLIIFYLSFCHEYFQSPPDQRKQVWITCNGLDDIDKENIKGFRFSPHGFPSFYYPFKNTASYLSPLVAVEVQSLTGKYSIPYFKIVT